MNTRKTLASALTSWMRVSLAATPLLLAGLIAIALWMGQLGPAAASPRSQYPVLPTPTTAPPTWTPVRPTPTAVPAAPATATPVPTAAPAATASPRAATTVVATATIAAGQAGSPTATRPASAATSAPANAPTNPPAGVTAPPIAPRVEPPPVAAVEENGLVGLLRGLLNVVGTLWLICGSILFLGVVGGVVFLFRGKRS